ncbi:glycosyltransferase [Vibrio owensii]|uniref:glycosyltransferase n=1 Tax=Vibrio owensii TaxID=696485 RepID=UPI00215D32CE|nr:glycosyltransferase [Vibrio owensii]MCR9944549.1 glycosyltransferase [Vibrio owensii]
MVKVAVLMSVYKSDRIEYLERAVNSVLEQTFQDFKFYIAIDGPVESTLLEYLLEVEAKSDKVSVLQYENNKGLATRLNDLLHIINLDTFDFIARMDADDISLPTRFEEQLKFIESHNYDVVGSGMIEIDKFENRLQEKVMQVSHEGIVASIVKRCPVNHPTVLIKSSVFKHGHRYDSSLLNTQDYELWIRLLKEGYQFGNVPKPLLMFRRDENFFQRRSSKKVLNEIKFKYVAWQTFSRKASDLLFIAAFFIMRLSPVFVQKFAYKRFR